jgi:hypothetical protein
MRKWSRILDNVCGYVGALDDGWGIIHPNEPSQMIVFRSQYANLLTMSKNIDRPVISATERKFEIPKDKSKSAIELRIKLKRDPESMITLSYNNERGTVEIPQFFRYELFSTVFPIRIGVSTTQISPITNKDAIPDSLDGYLPLREVLNDQFVFSIVKKVRNLQSLMNMAPAFLSSMCIFSFHFTPEIYQKVMTFYRRITHNRAINYIAKVLVESLSSAIMINGKFQEQYATKYRMGQIFNRWKPYFSSSDLKAMKSDPSLTRIHQWAEMKNTNDINE